MPRFLTRLLVSLLVAVLAACQMFKTKKQTAEEVYEKAKTAVEKSFVLLDAGDVNESQYAMGSAKNILSRYTVTNERLGETDRSRLDEVVEFRSLRQWQIKWLENYQAKIEDSWPQIEQALREENMEISSMKGFMRTYGTRDMYDRLLATVKDLKSYFKEQAGGQYFFECSADRPLCDAVLEGLRKRMPSGTIAKSLHVSRKNYAGIINTEIIVSQFMEYKKGNVGAGTLPTQVAIRLNVQPNGSSTTEWDGKKDFVVSENAPSSVRPEHFDEMHDRHYASLREKIVNEVKAWPPDYGNK